MMDEVAIGTFDGTESRVLVFLNRNDVKNGNVIGQIFIETEQEFINWLDVDICMKEILACMNVCISPAAADYCHGAFYNSR